MAADELPRDEQTGKVRRLGVRISPLAYEWSDDDGPAPCYWTNVWGVMYTQPRHLKSSRMATWN